MPVETDPSDQAARAAPLEIRLLGPLAIGGAPAMPASRKLRALLAYLALAPHPVTRGQLCELLWDVPDDPRGELRWCLSKLRSVLDAPARKRVQAQGDAVRLDLSDCRVDALAILATAREGFDALSAERLRALAGQFAGDFLEGLEIDRNPGFESWLVAQRRRFRDIRLALLEQLVRRAPETETSGDLDLWLSIAPFDARPHEILLTALAAQGRIREGEEHLAATLRLFASEGLDGAALRGLWRAARTRAEAAKPEPPPARAVPSPTPCAVAQPAAEPEPSSAELEPEGGLPPPRRASVAVMPFIERTLGATLPGGLADALAYDVIARLAKLRSLFVIAQGTVFALRDRCATPEEAGRLLGVDYVVSGSAQRRGERLLVSVELAETRGGRIAWTEVFDRKSDDAFLVLDEIGNGIVAAIDREIEAIERNRAVLKPPNALDAWEAHHRGLWHMYRFNKADNAQAGHFFEMALRLDPTFARAHAGLSFTHWQNAFQGWAARDHEVERAYAAAGQALMADECDPAAHLAMGRALWLRGGQEQSLVELNQAIDLSPNLAQGHYALGFVHALAGDPIAAVSSVDHSRRLSPFDPLLFAIFASRAMALARLGHVDEAADWAVKAASRPNAHAQILATAAYCLGLAGRIEEARDHLAAIHRTLPLYRVDDYLAAFQFGPDTARLFREAARRIAEG